MNRYKTFILAVFLSLVMVLFSFTFLRAEEINKREVLFSLSFPSDPLDSVDSEKNEKLSLTLQEAIEIALAKNKGILITKEKIKEAQQSVKIARSGYFPSLDLNVNYTYLSEVPSFEVPGGGTVEMGQKDNYNIALSLAQPLYASGRISLGYKQTKLNYQKAKEDLSCKESEIIFEVKKAFYSSLLARENLNLVKESLEQAQRHLNVVESFYQTGRVSKFDLLTTKVEVSNIKPGVIQAENALRLSVEGLANLLSLPPASLKLKGEFKFEPIKIGLEEAIEKALSYRSDLKSLELQEKMGEISFQLAHLANKPSLSLVSNYQHSNPFKGKKEWGEDWNVNLILSMHLLDVGKSQAIVSQRKSQLSQINLSLEQLKDGIMLQVKSAFWNIKAVKQSILAQKENIGQAKEALLIAESRYKNGTITNLEALDAQLALTRAKVGYLKALYDYNIAQATLEKTINIK